MTQLLTGPHGLRLRLFASDSQNNMKLISYRCTGLCLPLAVSVLEGNLPIHVTYTPTGVAVAQWVELVD